MRPPWCNRQYASGHQLSFTVQHFPRSSHKMCADRHSQTTTTQSCSMPARVSVISCVAVHRLCIAPACGLRDDCFAASWALRRLVILHMWADTLQSSIMWVVRRGHVLDQPLSVAFAAIAVTCMSRRCDRDSNPPFLTICSDRLAVLHAWLRCRRTDRLGHGCLMPPMHHLQSSKQCPLAHDQYCSLLAGNR